MIAKQLGFVFLPISAIVGIIALTVSVCKNLVACECIPASGQPQVAAGSTSHPGLVSEPPKDVTFVSPETNTFEGDVESFARFAWSDFIALNWPAHAEARGRPNLKKQFGDKTNHVVWQTWLSMADIFPADALEQPLKPWDKISLIQWIPHKKKLHELNQAGFSTTLNDPGDPFSLPLVAQNKTYVRYEIHVNKEHYEKVRSEGLNLTINLPKLDAPGFSFPEQSMVVKAAWMVLDEQQQKQGRFFTAGAKIADWNGFNPPAESQHDAVLGLVGLHIVHKTPGRPASVWASFEQVDNVQPGEGATGQASFNNGDKMLSATKATDLKPLELGKPLPPPIPTQVVRIGPGIHKVIQSVNAEYQKQLASPWKYYQLVGVQWPIAPAGPDNHLPGKTTPGQFVANTSIETFSQFVSCMDCHSPGFVKEGVFYLHRRSMPRDTDHETKIGDRIKDLLKREHERLNIK